MSARALLAFALLSACAGKPEPPKPFTSPETHMAAWGIMYLTNHAACPI